MNKYLNKSWKVDWAFCVSNSTRASQIKNMYDVMVFKGDVVSLINDKATSTIAFMLVFLVDAIF